MKTVASVLVLFLAACASAPPPRPPSAPQVEAKTLGTVKVTASALNVRAEASTQSEVVTQVRRGTELSVLQEEKSWLRVRLANGETGWVSAQHISRGGAPAAKRRGGCPPDSDFAFEKTPMPSFSEKGGHGLVVVDASVNTRGEVTSTRVVSNSTGDTAMGAMAEKEIRSARFIPPIRSCVPRAFIFTYKRAF